MRAEVYQAVARCSRVSLVLSNGSRFETVNAGETMPAEKLEAFLEQEFRAVGIVGWTKNAELVTEFDRPEDIPAILAAALREVAPLLESMRAHDDLELLALLPDPREEN